MARFHAFARGALSLTVLMGLAACGSSSGGQQSGGTGSGPTNTANNGSNAAAANGGTATGAATGATTANGADGTAGTTTTGGTGTATATGGGEVASGADPSDQAICQFLASQPDVTSHTSTAYNYLCSQGGLAALRQANGTAKMISQTQDQNNNTVFLLGGAVQSKGTPAEAAKLGTVFCTSFSQYEAIMGSAMFAQVQSITPSNAAGNGCDFVFKGQPILGGLIGQPQYQGHEEDFASSDGTIEISVQFMTQSLSSLVGDAQSLTVAAQYQGGLFTYAMGYSVAKTDGFASTAGQDLVQAAQAGLQGTQQAFAKGGF